jgi:Asp-tRNA(Asn)/Glu-tRNA(Gln) amidotransferase A subunit family amidase
LQAERYCRLTAVELHSAVARGESSAEAIARAALARTEEREPTLHAWKLLDAPGLIAMARAVDGGHMPGLLAGVPLGVKDIIDVAGLPTGQGSPLYEGRRADADAWCVARARAAGALFPGKTVTTEFAYFSPGPTTNPHRSTHTPGGSSSGSAAAVAAGMVPVAFGTQTAGSLVRPASFCGVFAIKPGFGHAPMDGIKPFAPSLDTLGWFARDAQDLELMRCAIAGLPFEPLALPDAAALRLGVCPTHEWNAIDAGGALVFEEAVRLAARAGLGLQEVAPPPALAGLVQAQKTIMAFEAARSLAAERTHHAASLSAPLRELLDLGAALAPDDYAAARRQAERGRAALPGLFDGIDALLVPSAPGEAPAGLAATGDPVFSRVWTLLGVPCVNVPGLHGPQGLPVGVQLVGRQGGERALLAIAGRLGEILQRHEG